MLNFDLHTHSIGTEATFAIDVAFKFHPKGYKPKYTNAALFNSLTYDLDIPGNKETVVEALYPMSRAGMILGFEPHLHSSGRRMCLEALHPTGYQETLNCAGYNHNWVKVYHYEDNAAPLLPKGTVLKVTAWYDNTASNPRVADPRNWKGWGSRSIDDMMFLFRGYLADGSGVRGGGRRAVEISTSCATTERWQLAQRLDHHGDSLASFPLLDTLETSSTQASRIYGFQGGAKDRTRIP